MSEFNFSEFTRQNVLGVLVLFVQSVRRTINAYLAFFAYSIFSGGWTSYYIWTMIGISFVFIGVSSALKYKNFMFRVTDSQLELRSGVITKDVTNIPLDRIQSVQLHQNFIQRILKITGLKIDTAGSSAQELEIPALKKPVANALLAQLQAYIPSKSAIPDDHSTEVTDEAVQEEELENTELVKLDFKALIVMALTENHVRNGLLFIAVIVGYASQFNVLENYLMNTLDQIDEELLQSALAQTLAFIVVFLVVSVALSFIQVFLKFYDFKAEVNDKSFMIKAGLLKRNEYTIPIKKIQFLEWKTNILRKIPGFESIKIHQGRSVESVKKNQVEIPACYAEQTNLVMEKLFPESKDDSEFYLLEPNAFQVRFRSIMLSLLGIPVCFTGAMGSEFYVSWALGYVAYVIFSIYNAKRYVDSVNLWTSDELLIYERGWIFPKRTVVKLYKMQTVEINQSIFQKRRGLCHLSFSTAAGGRTFRFFEESEMKELKNYLLYKIESTSKSWM